MHQNYEFASYLMTTQAILEPVSNQYTLNSMVHVFLQVFSKLLNLIYLI